VAGGRVARVDGVVEENPDARRGERHVLVGARLRRPDEEGANAASGVGRVDVALGLEHRVVPVVQGGVAGDAAVWGENQPGVGVQVERAPVAAQLLLREVRRAIFGGGDHGEEGGHRRQVARGRPADGVAGWWREVGCHGSSLRR
jgi:hypothetical protein